jgi:hypothetical protein
MVSDEAQTFSGTRIAADSSSGVLALTCVAAKYEELASQSANGH